MPGLPRRRCTHDATLRRSRWRVATGLTAASLAAVAAGLAVTGPAAAAARPAAATATPVTSVTVSKTAISGLPTSVAAGWRTFAVTQSGSQAREFSVGQLKPGVTLAGFEQTAAAANSSTKAIIKLFKSVTVNGGVDTTKGYLTTKRSYTTYLTPGKWIAANVAANDGPSDFSTFTVSPGSVGSRPRTTAAVVLSDFKFTLRGLKAGTQQVNFYNPSPQSHQFILAKIDPGHTNTEVLQGLQAETPPSFIHQQGYYGFLSPKQSMVGTVTLAHKTEYIAVCFLPDYNQPTMYTPHAAEGMYKIFTTS